MTLLKFQYKGKVVLAIIISNISKKSTNNPIKLVEPAKKQKG